MAQTMTKRRSSRQMATRKRSRYVDPETDDDLVEGSEEEYDSELPFATSPRPGKRRRTQHRPKTRSKSIEVKRPRPRPKKKQKRRQVFVVGQPRRANNVEKESPQLGKFTGPSDGVIPPWTTIPADVLRDIFLFASQPLTAANATWLLGAARTCRAFMEPALEALYYWPAIWSPLHLHRLLELLQKREGRLMNYNVKIKRLDIDVRRLAYTAHNRPLFDLSLLIPEMPRLQHMEIVHPIDEPPYREIKVQNWYYPDPFLRTLATSELRLSAWRWTREMLKNRSPTEGFEIMTKLHSSRAFETVRELVICGFSIDDTGKPYLPLGAEDTEERAAGLSAAISPLKNLKDITFISCNVVRERFLPTLPAGLERLELSNCWEVNSEILAQYLKESGTHLKELVLNHNPALDLAFLPGLKINCPRLETLEMDLHFYSEYIVTNDAEPLFDELLTADEEPTWPTTMQHIDLVHMQKWSADGAKNLFRSLIENAPMLPNLRYIVLHSHINIPWRDRAGFRDDWIDRLEKVYKRRSKPPNEFNGSKKQYQMWLTKQAQRTVPSQPSTSHDTPQESVSEPQAEASMSATASTRRSVRVASRPSPIKPSLTSEASSQSSPDTSTIEEDFFVQGLCDIVDIRIDNQRPRENQFTEQDFLDSEASGDEDWNENAEETIEDGYAW